MDRRTFVKTVPAMAVLAGSVSGLAQESATPAGEMQPIVLPRPEKDGGKSVLAAWFHNCDKENTVKEFKLRPQQRVLFAHTVGYPA
jgi:invasion protein IalB